MKECHVRDLLRRVYVYWGMVWLAQYARIAVQVLVQGELEDRHSTIPMISMSFTSLGCTSVIAFLPWHNSRVSQEEHPYPVPSLAISLNDLLLVWKPVLVPPPDSCAIMHAEYVDILDLETSRFHLVDNPWERARRISTREDVFVHEKTPIHVPRDKIPSIHQHR